MAFQNPQGTQLDIQSVAAEIAADSTAIGSIATGVTTDPGAVATMDSDYLRRDGTNSMTAALDVGLNNIVNVGTVDGRDVSADGMAQDSHLANATVHFTEASIDHANILNIGTNSHADIDTHIGNATLHFTEASIDHNNIQNNGVNDHAAIDSHIANMALHRTINDGGSAATDLWSASKIGVELGTKADLVSGAVNGNFAGLDAGGNLTDSGSNAASFATAAQGTTADSATQPGDNVSTLTNDANFTTDAAVAVNHYTKTEADAVTPAAGAKVDKVAGVSGNVVEFGASNAIADSGVATTSLAPVASPTFTGVPTVPSYVKASLPAVGSGGGLIYVSDATGASVTGSLCFSNGTSWIDVTTGIAVA